MEVVRRAFLTNFETREENGSGIVEGRPVVLNSPTDLGFCDEVIYELEGDRVTPLVTDHTAHLTTLTQTSLPGLV